jgi:hypothetical protein|tara:strand:- start:1359 stop:1532 length:174 start_codon:yes stop_codon:yes gene_type:complete
LLSFIPDVLDALAAAKARARVAIVLETDVGSDVGDDNFAHCSFSRFFRGGGENCIGD